MSIVFPSHKREFLAPSKTLQDLKKKLGAIYFDAKLIECPQNAVELCKLLQTVEELDKQKFKLMQESSRQQRVLQSSLSTRHLTEPSTSSLAQVSSRNVNELARKSTGVLPPGFRFHANGDPKSSEDLAVDDSTESRSSLPSLTSRPNVTSASWVKFSLAHVAEDEDENDDRSTAKNVEGADKKEKGFEQLDYSREIEDLELIIRQLAAQLKIQSDNLNATHTDETTNPTVKHNFLRAHSHSDSVFESALTKPSTNYAYDPEVNYIKDKPGSRHTSRHCKSLTRSSKCLACQFKLKHVGNEFYNPTKTDRLKEKWNIAPKGCFISSPNIALASSTSLAKRASSKILPADRLPSHHITTPSSHSPSKFVAAISVGDRRSASSPAMKVRRSQEDNIDVSYNPSRSSYRFSSPGPSLMSTPSQWRYLSSEEKSSRMKLLKNQAMRDVDDCQEKVDAFLGDLRQHARKNKSGQPWI